MRAREEAEAPVVSVPAIQLDSLLAVIRLNVDGMLVIDHHGVIQLANPAAESLLGQPTGGLTGTAFGAPLTLEKATEIDVVTGATARTAEMRVVEINWHEEPAFLASLRDVTDRKRTGAQHAAIGQLGADAVSGLAPEALMVEAAKHIQRVLATDFAGVLAFGAQGNELWSVAAEWSSVPDLPPESAGSGTQPRYTLDAPEPVVMNDADQETRFIAWPPGMKAAATVVIKDREKPLGVIEAASRSTRPFEQDELTFLQSVANLLAAALARFHAEHQMRHQALHDPLTGLPNRALFIDRLAHGLARAKRRRTGLVVVFADLDGFKHVNDTLGHHAGDEVLVSVARRLSDALRSSDSLARFGGDEFMMLLEDVGSQEVLQRAVARVQTAITGTPFVVDGQPQQIDLTLGVVWADDSHTAPADLIRDADAAMYSAKELGRGGYAVFDHEMRERVAQCVHVEQELRGALAAGELRLLYQPIVSLDDGRVVELEALLRWQHPERGLLGPADFLDVAIESRLILPIGRWALAEACRQAAEWQAAGLGDRMPTLNVNMAPSELAQPELRAIVRAAIQQGGLEMSLQLELTEGALIRDPTLPSTLHDLSTSMGVRTALDDFGTGYSSLAYLTRFRIDELKIDRSFIRTLRHGKEAPIVAAIVSMAHALNILVVAEGIETEEQATEVRRLGCDRGQGYHFSPPLPPEEVLALLTGATPPEFP